MDLNALYISVWSTKSHCKPGCFSFFITKWYGDTRGQSCRLLFLHIEWCQVAAHHPLYFLYCEAQLGRRNGTEYVPFVCMCVAMSCLCFAGDSLSSLEASQDLFSPSLYITANGITEAMCPVLSSSTSCCFATSCSSFPHPSPSCVCGSF